VDPSTLADEQFCYLTTRGRVTGRPHRIEIWFGLEGSTLYLLSGGRNRSGWGKNLHKTPEVTVEIGAATVQGRARTVEEGPEAELARTLLVDKYQPGYGGDLSGWRASALPVAVDLDAPADG
jgi:nitroimidazol reductase NimA-like FMN-containing flavoprotein (pyridoxamine 5'-phosphate oxidase superfamily)